MINLMENKSLLLNLTDSILFRMVDFLLDNKGLDCTKKDIAEGAGIGRTTLFRIWNDFVELGIVKHTRDIGNAKLYRLNLANHFARKMADLFDTLVIEPLNKKRKLVVKH